MRDIIRKPAVTTENVIRALAVIVTIIFFCPIFSIAYSEQKVGISAMKMIGGIKYSGEYLVKPQPLLLLLLLLPIAILVVLVLRNITEEMVSLITAVCGAVDLVAFFVFRAIAKNMSEKIAFSFKSTGWFVIGVLFLIAIIALAVLTVLRVLYLEDDLVVLIREKANKDTTDQMASAVKQIVENISGHVGKAKAPKEDIMGYCFKCGTAIVFGDELCTSCGWPVPEAFIAEAEEERRAAEEARRAEEEARRKEEEARRAAEEAARKEAEERARREAEERARREAEERARREAEEMARREAEEARRAAEEEARRAEEEAWLREEEERRRRNAARRSERPERRRVAPPRRREDEGYFDDDFVDERTDRAIAELAYEPESNPRPRPMERSRSGARSGERSRSGSKPRMEAKSRAIYCLRCGEKLPSDAVFCTYCGIKIAE